MAFCSADDRDATLTAAPGASSHEAPAEPGILWVAPEERFAPLLPTLVGRDAECGVRLEGHRVSRRHARLEREGPLWLLRDLDSKNGVWADGRREPLVALAPQTTLRIGDWVGVVCAMPRGTDAPSTPFHTYPPALTVSAPTAHGLGRVLRLATRGVPIALYGESGTGKDVLARAIHHASGREGAFVAINCAALPEAMAEGLLFGHRKGAFTGAQTSADGYVLAAHRGTLFLDEIADLSLPVQAKLLRVLEERRVVALGSTQARDVDFRLIVACQEPLATLVADGSFRGDLYARVSGAEHVLAPLRERRQEIMRLFSTFLADAGHPARVDAALVEALCRHDWPYNVRELKQLAHVLEPSASGLSLGDLPARFAELPAEAAPGPASDGPGRAEAGSRRKAWLLRYAHELDALQRALAKHDGNVSSAALEAGVPRHRARRLLAAEAELRAGGR